jgi:hypothetical protein
MARKTPPFEPYPEWTTARFFSFLRSALRSAYNRYPPKFGVLAAAKRPAQVKRLKWEFQCASCKQWFPQKEVQVDHKEPAGKLQSFEDLPVFAKRLFVGPAGLQVLCSGCHGKKTREERAKNDS